MYWVLTRGAILAILLFAISWTRAAHSACCQVELEQGTPLHEEPEHIQRYFRLVGDTDDVFQITVDGSIHSNSVPRRVYRTPLPLVELLANPVIAAELGIDESQRKKLDEQAARLQKACEQADALYRKRDFGSNQLEPETLKILEPAVNDAIREVREILLKFQLDRFRQILIQLEINRRGLLWFFESRFGDEIGLAPDEKQALRQRHSDEMQAALGEIQRQKEKAIDKIFSAVPELVRTEIIQSLGDQDNQYRTPLMLLAIQCSDEAIDSFAGFDIESLWPRYSGISLPFSFQFNSLGQAVYSPEAQNADQIDRSIPLLLMAYCLSGSDFELVPEQVSAIKDLRRNQLAFWESQTAALNQYIQEHGTYDIPEALLDNRSNERRHFDRAMVDAIEQILLPHQLSVMEQYAVRSRFSFHGPVAAILNYEKRVEGFALTASQRNELRDNARAVREEAMKELVRLERQLNQRMLDGLSAEHRKKLDELAGAWLNLERGNLELHASMTERPDLMMSSNRQPIWMDEVEVNPRAVEKPSDSDKKDPPDNSKSEGNRQGNTE